jgi:hydroxyacylglutathione hydrolase
MLLKRFYDTKLAQASYLIGCQATGDAIVIDANRDVAQYVRAAADDGVRITHVTETHIHADFVSGSRELAATVQAQLLLSDEGDADWKYTFAESAHARLLREGDTIMVGNIRFDVMHTPGHTPEHLSFLVTDTPAAAGPIGVITGDFVFAGDVGRPDLLEKAAHVVGTMEASARTLYRSVQRFRQLPDHLQIWPGHGAGSACGKALGAVPMSTVGYEKIANWAFRLQNEDAFVAEVLAGQPEPPKYFAEMKWMNKRGPAILGGFTRPPNGGASDLAATLAARGFVIDTRAAAEFAQRYAHGTINIPLNSSFTTWAGWLAPYDRDFSLIVDDTNDTDAIDVVVRDLAMIGLDRVLAYMTAEVLDTIGDHGIAVGSVPQIAPTDVAALLAAGSATVIDVRGASEWDAGHVPGVRNIPVGYLTDHIGEFDAQRPVIVHCQSGARSAIAASVLRARGVSQVMNMTGGYLAWCAKGLPSERTAGHASSTAGA